MADTRKPTYEELEKRVRQLEKAEAGHREAEERLRLQSLVLDQIQDRVTITDLNGIITYVNQAEVQSLGYQKHELIGAPTEKYGDDPKKGYTQREILEATRKQGAWRGEVTNYSADGHERILDCRTQVIKDENGTPVALSGIATDITENKLAEEHSHRLMEAINASMDGIAILDPNERFIYMNSAHAHIYGYDSTEELIGESWKVLYDKNELKILENRIMPRFLKKGRWRGEATGKKKNGTKFPQKISLAAIKNGGLVCVVRDITDKKRAEEEKLTAQSTAAKHEKYALVGKIAGKMAHDFNNILGGVMGNVQLATMKCNESSVQERLEIIFEQSQRGKNLTRNLVAFAKDQEPKQEFFSINEKIDLVLNLMKKDLEEVFVKRDYTPHLPELLADPGMMEHALVNIIQNSVHAVSMAEHPVVTVRTYTDNGHIVTEIEDNGCGIPQDCIEQIYEPAFTLKGSMDETGCYKAGIKGTGYGLANVKKYIEQHKGSISINTEANKGTLVSISLPVIKKQLDKTAISEMEDEAVHTEKSILIVEDEEAISEVQYNILTHPPCNHKVDLACNGQEAIDMFEKNEYDLISLDYILPGTTSGMDIYKHIRETDKSVPILFISGNLEFLESIKDLKKEDPHIDHVSKPCRNQDYIKAVNRLFEIHRE